MELISTAEVVAFVQVVFVDLVLAGDNAVVVGMAVAGLPREQRARAMALGIVAATVMRILFASVTVQLLQIIGLTLAGGLLLLWVSWKLWRELEEARHERRARRESEAAAAAAAAGERGDGDLPNGALAADGRTTQPPRKTMRQAATQIVLADISMSLDNVLAVAGVAREHTLVLVFGLALSVLFMGLAAVLIARLLARFHWIAYVGLALIFYVAVRMIFEGSVEVIEVGSDLASAL
jgi:YjbE family integral membrane protein